MARGSSNISTWDHWVAQLRIKRSRFRMVRKSGKPFIFIREIADGKAKREFSSKVFRVDSDDDITSCAQQCLWASKSGRWGSTATDSGKKLLTWEIVAESALENLRARVARVGSRKNAEGHLKEIAQFNRLR